MSRVEGHSGAERPETPGGFGVGPPATGNDDAAGNDRESNGAGRSPGERGQSDETTPIAPRAGVMLLDAPATDGEAADATARQVAPPG